MTDWPIAFTDVLAAQKRIRAFIPPTAFRHYEALDAQCDHALRVLVKHENHNPTNAFKARNGMALISALSDEERARGVVAATRGNHGQGLAWAGKCLDVPVTICVPLGNDPEKNEAIRGFGARLIEEGRDYDEALQVAEKLVKDRGLRLAHSTNDREVIAGAATITLEMLEQEPQLDALVVAVGGGSQAVYRVATSAKPPYAGC